MTNFGLVRKIVRVLNLNPKNLWIGYVIGFVLIAILLTISQLVSSWNIKSSELHTKTSQITSHQTELSQQIFTQFKIMTNQQEQYDSHNLKSLMLKYCDNYKSIQALSLQFSFADHLVKHQADWKPDELKNLHEKFVGYYLTRLAELKWNSISDKQHDGPLSAANYQEKQVELSRLHHEIENHLDIAELKRVELTANINLLSYIAVMVLLVSEAILIFWPGHVITSRYYSRNKRQKDRMWELMHNLSKRNREISDAYDRIGHDALHDSLTGLANRRYLKEELCRRVDLHRSANEKIGVCHIDLDKFKRVNDAQGHKAGDFVLRFVSKILNEYTADGDFVARIGGDEFVIVSSPVKNMADMSSKALDINSKIQRKLLIEGRPCEVSASIGVDVVDIENFDGDIFDSKIDVSDFLIRADIALYEAKTGWCMF